MYSGLSLASPEASLEDPQLIYLLKLLSKKNHVTRVKALDEITVHLQSYSMDSRTLSVLIERFRVLMLDSARPVRERLFTPLVALLSDKNVQSLIDPTLLQRLLPRWMLLRHDPTPQVAATATAAYKSLFSSKTLCAVIDSCFREVFRNLGHTQKSLSDSRVFTPEESTERYERVVSSSLSVLVYLVPFTHTRIQKGKLPESALCLEELSLELLKSLLDLSQGPLVRKAALELCTAACNWEVTLTSKFMNDSIIELMYNSSITAHAPVLHRWILLEAWISRYHELAVSKLISDHKTLVATITAHVCDASITRTITSRLHALLVNLSPAEPTPEYDSLCHGVLEALTTGLSHSHATATSESILQAYFGVISLLPPQSTSTSLRGLISNAFAGLSGRSRWPVKYPESCFSGASAFLSNPASPELVSLVQSHLLPEPEDDVVQVLEYTAVSVLVQPAEEWIDTAIMCLENYIYSEQFPPVSLLKWIATLPYTSSLVASCISALSVFIGLPYSPSMPVLVSILGEADTFVSMQDKQMILDSLFQCTNGDMLLSILSVLIPQWNWETLDLHPLVTHISGIVWSEGIPHGGRILGCILDASTIPEHLLAHIPQMLESMSFDHMSIAATAASLLHPNHPNVLRPFLLLSFQLPILFDTTSSSDLELYITSEPSSLHADMKLIAEYISTVYAVPDGENDEYEIWKSMTVELLGLIESHLSMSEYWDIALACLPSLTESAWYGALLTVFLQSVSDTFWNFPDISHTALAEILVCYIYCQDDAMFTRIHAKELPICCTSDRVMKEALLLATARPQTDISTRVLYRLWTAYSNSASLDPIPGYSFTLGIDQVSAVICNPDTCINEVVLAIASYPEQLPVEVLGWGLHRIMTESTKSSSRFKALLVCITGLQDHELDWMLCWEWVSQGLAQLHSRSNEVNEASQFHRSEFSYISCALQLLELLLSTHTRAEALELGLAEIRDSVLKSLISIFCDAHCVSHVLCCAGLLESVDLLCRIVHSISGELEVLEYLECEKLVEQLSSPSPTMSQAAYHILSHILCHNANTEEAEVFPEWMWIEISRGPPLVSVPMHELYTRRLLLCWKILLDVSEVVSVTKRAMLGAYLRNMAWGAFTDVLKELLEHILIAELKKSSTDLRSIKVLLQDVTPVYPREGLKVTNPMNRLRALTAQHMDLNCFYPTLSAKLFYRVLKVFPALCRGWYREADKGFSQTITQECSMHFSPLLIEDELSSTALFSETVSEFSITCRPALRSISAKTIGDEISLKLLIKLPETFPLVSPNVTMEETVGVKPDRARRWSLTISSMLNSRNSSILDALIAWKANVDKYFDGVEECPICYSVVSQANSSLPDTSCRVCDSKFHSPCLYKWFKTSKASTCPMCRSVF